MKTIAPLTIALLAVASFLGTVPASAQACYTASDMEPAVLASLQSTVRNYHQGAQAGDKASLQQNAEFDLGDVLAANQALLNGQATMRSAYLLDNNSGGANADPAKPRRAEFFCGVYNSADRVALIFGGLPPGRYGVAVEDIAGKVPSTVTWILRQTGSQWKIAGLYIKSSQAAGHNAEWYTNQARSYKNKGQVHNAWLYYLVAEDLMRPFPAISTPKLDALYDEMQAVKPSDFPYGDPVNLVADGRAFKLAEVFAAPVADSLDLVVRYLEPDISDTNKTFQSNMALIRALVAKYPELREAFGGVVARAVAPNGQDYGSLLAMKDVK